MNIRIACLVVVLLLCPVGAVMSQSAPAFSVDAHVGLLFDFDSGQILFDQRGDEPWVPASLVKIMTMFVVFDAIAEGRINQDDVIIVSERAWRMGGSQMFLEVGERVSVEDLLYGIAVVSGNDACVAVAEAIAGSEELFIRWMNDKADDLGLALRFTDVHGLSENNQINAVDMALLIRHYLTNHPYALEYHRERTFGYQPRSRSEPIVQRNRNGLLWTYEGTDGLKTGFLSKAGYNLVATAKRDGRRLVAIILGSASEQARETEVVGLLNYGFRNFEVVPVAKRLPMEQERVYKGQNRTVGLRPVEDVVTIPRGAQQDLAVQLDTKQLVAPISAGQDIGYLVISHRGELVNRIPLVATTDVPRGNLFRVMIDSVILFFQQLIGR